MAQSALRRISLPEWNLAVLTQNFLQVGFSVLRRFRLIVLPSEQPGPTTAEHLTALSVRGLGTATTSRGLSAARVNGLGTALTGRGLTALSVNQK